MAHGTVEICHADPKKLKLWRLYLEKLGVPIPNSELGLADALNNLNLTSERMELVIHGDKLPTTVDRPEPTVPIENPFKRLGARRFIPHHSAKLSTCDIELIEAFQETYQRLPPSFPTAGMREWLYFDPNKVNVAVAVSGGSAPGVNAVIHWLVCRHCEKPYGPLDAADDKKFMGYIEGFKGLSGQLSRNYIQLDPGITKEHLHEPGCFVGQSRIEAEPIMEAVIKTLERDGIDILYLLGGDGSLEGARKIWFEVQRRGLKTAIVGIPKTIDNDVLWCWHSLGFESALEATARALTSFHYNVKCNGRVGVVIVYGGDAGFLAAMASAACGRVDWVVIPEKPVSVEELKRRITSLVSRSGDDRNPLRQHALIVVAEGAARNGEILSLIASVVGIPPQELARLTAKQDSPVLREGLQKALASVLEDRSVNCGHHPAFLEPRALVHCVPPLASDLLKAQRLAYEAVDNALAGYRGFMPSFWQTEVVLVPLAMALAGRKRLNLGVVASQAEDSTGQSRK
jgi:6-phosphofructokinase 1